MVQFSTLNKQQNAKSTHFSSTGEVLPGSTSRIISNWNDQQTGGDPQFYEYWSWTTPEKGMEYEEEFFPNQSEPFVEKDFATPAEAIYNKGFHSPSENLIVWAWYLLEIKSYETGRVVATRPGVKLKHVSFAPANPTLVPFQKDGIDLSYFTFYYNETVNPRKFNGGSIWAYGRPKEPSSGDEGYSYNSTPALENYAWELNQEKTATDENKKEKVIHNIRIQGGLMISDEYSAPVLP